MQLLNNEHKVFLSPLGDWRILDINGLIEFSCLEKFKNYRDPATYKSNPGKNNTIMPWAVYAHLDDFDIKAIYRYLRTLQPVNNAITKYPQ